jgi:hypothetical protein
LFLERCAKQKKKEMGNFKKIVTLLLYFYVFMYLSHLRDWSRGIVFGTVTGLPIGRPRYHHWISGTVAPVLGPLNLLFERYWRIFLWAVKWLGSEVDLLPPSSAKMKNGVGAHSPFLLLSWRPLRQFYFYVTPMIALLDC